MVPICMDVWDAMGTVCTIVVWNVKIIAILWTVVVLDVMRCVATIVLVLVG